MKLKGLFAMLACAAIVSPAAADDALYMVLTGADGKTREINLDDIEKLTFKNGSMQVTKGGQTTDEFPLTSLQTMSFTDTPAGITAIGAESSSLLAYSKADAALKVMGNNGGRLQVFDMQGRILMGAQVAAGEVISLAQLQPGVYVIKLNETILKIAK